jgi:HlyD family secretion protein
MFSAQNFPSPSRYLRLLAFAVALSATAGCHRERGHFQGYIEAEYVYVSAPVGGTLLKRPVDRGNVVKAGQELFFLEKEREVAAQAEARERLAKATSRLEDLQKGRRPSEIAALEAKIADAKAAQALAIKERDRVNQLAKTNAVAKRDYDEAHAQFSRASASLEEANAQLITAKLGAREDEVAGATADMKSQEHALAQATWQVDQKTQRATFGGSVVDTFFEEGEMVAAGAPVLSLVSPDRLKLRFYIPEPQLSLVRVGSRVSIRADGKHDAVQAEVSFISPQAEFTPPVIFSRESRAKLVFLAEAKLQSPADASLNPGQPVDVTLE